MAKTRCYSVYDRKALVYQMPFPALTDGAAVRMLSDAVADPNTMLSKHPNDYVLYLVGEFDDASGRFLSAEPLQHVIDCSSLVRALQAEIPFPDGLFKGSSSSSSSSNGQDQVEA